jgi:uncharacterized protein
MGKSNLVQRALTPSMSDDLDRKIVLLTGPRQVGKTTVSRSLRPNYQYLNFDSHEHRRILTNQEWDRSTDLLVLDEIHKMPRWKSWIKGIYDTEGVRPRLLVTGSARLDVFRKGGDSLAGRHFLYRLHPFTVRELKGTIDSGEALRRILEVGGFPEPFLNIGSLQAERWRKSHLDVVIREDLLDLEKVRELKSIEILVSLLRERVGSTISYSSLSEDLGVSVHTVKHWLEILENLFVIFKVSPYSRDIARSLKKESKYYLFDTGAVENGMAAKLENAVACALLAELHQLEDTSGKKCALHFMRDKEKNEVDFVAFVDKKPKCLVEVKLKGDVFSKSLFKFRTALNDRRLTSLQVVHQLDQRRSKEGILMVSAKEFLEDPLKPSIADPS